MSQEGRNNQCINATDKLQEAEGHLLGWPHGGHWQQHCEQFLVEAQVQSPARANSRENKDEVGAAPLENSITEISEKGTGMMGSIRRGNQVKVRVSVNERSCKKGESRMPSGGKLQEQTVNQRKGRELSTNKPHRQDSNACDVLNLMQDQLPHQGCLVTAAHILRRTQGYALHQ